MNNNMPRNRDLSGGQLEREDWTNDCYALFNS